MKLFIFYSMLDETSSFAIAETEEEANATLLNRTPKIFFPSIDIKIVEKELNGSVGYFIDKSGCIF